MASALEQVAWPSAICDRHGGLWLACRSFLAEDTPDPQPFAILVASSWSGLKPIEIARGLHLSPPALVIDRTPEDVVRIAWAEGPGGSSGIHVVAVSTSGSSEVETVPGLASDVGRLGLVGATDATGRAWLAWQEVTGRDAVIQVSQRRADGWTMPETISPPGYAASEPCLAADPDGGLWVGWISQTRDGFVPWLRHRLATGVWEDTITAPAEGINLEPAIDVDGQGRVYLAWKHVAAQWGTLAGARLSEETQIYARVYDPRRQAWLDLEQDDGPLPIPAMGRSGSIAGRENLATWAPPLAPRILVDAGGGVRVLFRRFRDLHPVYDWGHDLYVITWTADGWGEPVMLSHTAGFPEAQHQALRMADGGAAVAYQFSHQPPTYWHCPNDHTDTVVGHSGIAISRYAWGGKLPTVRKVGEVRDENKLPGVPDLSKAVPTRSGWIAQPANPAGLEFRREPVTWRGEACFFGDLHNHSNLSTDMVNKDGSPHDHYRYARDFAGYDFYAITDHVEESGPTGWRDFLEITDAFSRPGGFIGWYALEWTNRIPADGTGSLQDTCVYCADRDAAWAVRHLARQEPDGTRLLPLLAQANLIGRVFIVRHFHGGRGYGLNLDEPCNQWMAQAGPGVEPVIELVQMRGPCTQIYQALLARGVRRGVIGGTDHGRPGGRVFVNGLTGIWASELTRGALFEAVGRRRTFAINGCRMAVDFAVGETPMGGETRLSGPVQLHGFVQGTTRLQTVTVYRDTQVWRTLTVTGGRAELDLVDDPGPGEHYYWLHATQTALPDQTYPGEVWSSPLWVTVPNPAAQNLQVLSKVVD